MRQVIDYFMNATVDEFITGILVAAIVKMKYDTKGKRNGSPIHGMLAG